MLNSRRRKKERKHKAFNCLSFFLIMSLKLPAKEACLDYFRQFHVPANILNHCLKVREVAVFLAEHLRNSGIGINVDLVDRASLLHDLFKAAVIKETRPNKFHQHEFSAEELKMRGFLREKYPGLYEGEIAYLFFKEDYPEMALTLKNCSNHKNLDPSWEELVIHYADFRVFREEVVPLEVRKKYLEEVYPAQEGRWDFYLEKMREVENRINVNLPFELKDLAVVMKNE